MYQRLSGRKLTCFPRSQLLGLRHAGLTGCLQRSSFLEPALGKRWHVSSIPSSPPAPCGPSWACLGRKARANGCSSLLSPIKVQLGFSKVSSWQDAFWASLLGLHLPFCPSTKQTFHLSWPSSLDWVWTAQTFSKGEEKMHQSSILQCLYNYRSLQGRREGHAFTNTVLHTCIYPNM